ncbi:hypothetical protein L249_7464, partial [Ophiocordyceps polyrhachis-furcata BCC 54312]
AYTEADCIAKEGTPCLLPDLPYVPSFVRPVRPVRPRAVAASYVVVPFLPLLCDVRRPRAGCSRHGVTVSGAPAKITLV